MLTFRKSGLIIENVSSETVSSRSVHAGPATAAKFVAQSTSVGAWNASPVPSALVQLLKSPVLAAASPATHDGGSCALDTIQQEMERLPHGTRRLAVRLRMNLDPTWLWAVLTDYANLSRFIPNLQSSRLLWRRANVVGLEQEGCQTFMGLRFKARVQLELTEQLEQQRLDFVMVKGDFRRFEGAWQIGYDERGSTLLYELTVQGCAGMPIGLIEQRLREDLAANLRAVQQEALRRACIR